MKKRKLIVISGPSGVGKDTIVKELINKNNSFELSISMTSRTIRDGEKDGVNYYFKTKEEFEIEIEKGNLLEWAKYNENYYGTPKSEVKNRINNGKNVILVIEVDGALQVKNIMKEDSILIFLLPPSMEELKNRLLKRNTDSIESINNRLKIAEKEIEISKKYDYRIVNEDINKTVNKIENIIKSEIN